jgi:hypothetical protein
MPHSRRALCSVFALIAIALSGCAVVDAFSERAVAYNREAERAQNRVLLLNIVRASLKRGMQFTTLQTVTGTAQVSGSVSVFQPYGGHPFAVPPSVTLDNAVSGGPTFTVPVLDTEEFYRGILEPLSAREYGYFIAEGYPPALIFYLFVGKIDITVLSGPHAGLTASFPNYPGDDYDLELFEAIADHLLALGLTVERVNASVTFGPPVPARKAADLKALVAAAAAGLELEPVAAPESGPRRAGPAPAPQYQIVRAEGSYRFCFNPRLERRPALPDTLLCTTARADAGRRGRGESGPALSAEAPFSPILAQRLAAIHDAYRTSVRDLPPLPALSGGVTVRFRFTMRSTEGVIHYLGEVVRRHLASEYGPRRTVQIKVGMPYLPYPETPCTGPGERPGFGYRCESLLVVETGPPSPVSPLSVAYDGRDFWIPADPRGAGWSLRALDLVKQLLALHTNAKELPAPNVLSIVAPP